MHARTSSSSAVQSLRSNLEPRVGAARAAAPACARPTTALGAIGGAATLLLLVEPVRDAGRVPLTDDSSSSPLLKRPTSLPAMDSVWTVESDSTRARPKSVLESVAAEVALSGSPTIASYSLLAISNAPDAAAVGADEAADAREFDEPRFTFGMPPARPAAFGLLRGLLRLGAPAPSDASPSSAPSPLDASSALRLATRLRPARLNGLAPSTK